MVTTSEVERLLEKHELLLPYPVENREKFLPTKNQFLTTISFLFASEKCKGVESWEPKWHAPKRAVCISEEFKKIEPEVKVWATRNPEDFKELYKRTVWSGGYKEIPI